MTHSPADADRLWTILDVATYLGVSRNTAWKVVKQRGFPPRLIITDQVHRWQPNAVKRWAATRREQKPPTRHVDAFA